MSLELHNPLGEAVPLAVQLRAEQACGTPVGAETGADLPRQRLDDLAEIVGAYNRVTKSLQESHEALRAEVVRLQEKLASTDAQLQRSKQLAALGEMAAGIAHEVRNPLAAIQLYAGVLAQGLRSGGERFDRMEAAQTADKIVAAVRGLDAIVSDVLSFARPFRLRPVPLQVSRLIDRALDSHRPGIEAAGVLVQRVGAAAREARHALSVCADPDWLHQAVLNLVRNAVDSMAEGARGRDAGGCVGVLTLGAYQEGKQVVLMVRDSGPGIAEADVDRIFNPFFTTRSAGTGLGLAIVHRIVDAHGGAISVYNDGGAVFELRLPAADEAECGVGETSEARSSSRGSE